MFDFFTPTKATAVTSSRALSRSASYDSDSTGTSYDDMSAQHRMSYDSSSSTLNSSPRKRQTRDDGNDYGDDEDFAQERSKNVDKRMTEVDYDICPSQLYKCIQDKNWDEAMIEAERDPAQIKTWVYRKEEGYRSKLRWRLLPLHATCIFKSPENLIELLLDNYPQGATLTDDQGMLPIHLACRNGASRSVVKMLLESYPESVNVTDRKNRTPFDLVETGDSFNKASVILILKRCAKELSVTPSVMSPPQLIVTSPKVPKERNAALKKEVDYENRTILLRLIMKKDWENAIERCFEYEDESATWVVTKGFNGKLRFLPLHKACVLSPPKQLISALISSYPKGVEDKDQDGWLPIHCACFYSASEEVIKSLLLSNEKGAQVKDDEGRLPIHYACLKGSSAATMKALLDAYPKGAQCKDGEGRLPIHHACSKGAPKEVIEELLRVSPRGAQSRDDQGRLPLHHACRKNIFEDVVKLLLEAYPHGAEVQEDQEKLPVHFACENPNGKEVVRLLLKACPNSTTVKDAFGNTPIEAAKLARNSSFEELFSTKVRSPRKMPQEASDRQGLVDKIAELEGVVRGFVLAGKEMQDALADGKDAKKVLENFSVGLADMKSVSKVV